MSNAIEAILPEVVDAAATGDQVAFARIVAAHHGDMARVAFLVCGDVDLAHEAVQTAWSVAWRKLGALRDQGRLRPWLVTVAANEARQLMRRRRRRRVVEIPMDELVGSTGFATSRVPADSGIDLQAALRRLSPEDRAIVAMRYALGLTSDEIGREVGLSAPGVRSRLSRALSVLRSELADD
jgi:RNA polymerase sigma factor (sigma-70 family)